MLIPIDIPPGAHRNGTNYQTKGQWWDVNRVRWIGPAMRPIGGWRERSAETVDGAARAIIAWADNAKVSWGAIGTHTMLYAMTRDGTLHDITPVGFAGAEPDSILAGGWGQGEWGEGTWGTPRDDDSEIIDASAWTLDTRGQYLIACVADDGRICQWGVTGSALDPGVRAAAITGSPSAEACFVTTEGAVVALGADGDPRRVAWSDWDDPEEWAADATNNAGDINLQTQGTLRCGKRIRGANLLWTDQDVWLMEPTNDQFVYGFTRLGTACGVISRNAVASLDDRSVWMSNDGFWIYDGGVQPLPCTVHDYVFSGLNWVQGAKVYAFRNSAFNEVTWFYPSDGATENDRYVSWNYQSGIWTYGHLGRTCAVDKGVFLFPVMVETTHSAGPPEEWTGHLWEHEFGYFYPDGVMPFAEAGPVELGAGDTVMKVTALYPDEAASGDVRVSFRTRFQPNGPLSTAGPYTLSPKTDVRFSSRQVSIRVEGLNAADWRVGVIRLDAAPGGSR